jgi:hypothetical protein
MAASIQINMHQVWVEIHTTQDHPDALHDLTNRAKDALTFAVNLAKENNIDITTKNIWVEDEEVED